jgi:hypothetical protein
MHGSATQSALPSISFHSFALSVLHLLAALVITALLLLVASIELGLALPRLAWFQQVFPVFLMLDGSLSADCPQQNTLLLHRQWSLTQIIFFTAKGDFLPPCGQANRAPTLPSHW